MFNLNLEHN